MQCIRVKRKIYSGSVLETEIYPINIDRVRDLKSREPSPRFKDPEDRRRHRDSIALQRMTRLINTNYDHNSLYSTLTFDNEHECHTFEEAKTCRNRFLRRVKYKYPDAVMLIVMGRGKSTNRIHLHMLSSGVPEYMIWILWSYGEIADCRKLRRHNYYPDGSGGMVDHGEDYTGLARYLFGHWTEEQKTVCKHRYMMTRNAAKPEKEDAKPIRRNYTPEKPPRTPKGYKLVEIHYTQYGYIKFKYVVDTGLGSPRAMNGRLYQAGEDPELLSSQLPERFRK